MSLQLSDLSTLIITVPRNTYSLISVKHNYDLLPRTQFFNSTVNARTRSDLTRDVLQPISTIILHWSFLIVFMLTCVFCCVLFSSVRSGTISKSYKLPLRVWWGCRTKFCTLILFRHQVYAYMTLQSAVLPDVSHSIELFVSEKCTICRPYVILQRSSKIIATFVDCCRLIKQALVDWRTMEISGFIAMAELC